VLLVNGLFPLSYPARFLFFCCVGFAANVPFLMAADIYFSTNRLVPLPIDAIQIGNNWNISWAIYCRFSVVGLENYSKPL
jgi:hypothetical protein